MSPLGVSWKKWQTDQMQLGKLKKITLFSLHYCVHLWRYANGGIAFHRSKSTETTCTDTEETRYHSHRGDKDMSTLRNCEPPTVWQNLPCQISLKHFRGLPSGKKRETHSSYKRCNEWEGQNSVQGRYLEFHIAIVLWEGEGRCTGCKNRKGFELAVWELTTINAAGGSRPAYSFGNTPPSATSNRDR